MDGPGADAGGGEAADDPWTSLEDDGGEDGSSTARRCLCDHCADDDLASPEPPAARPGTEDCRGGGGGGGGGGDGRQRRRWCHRHVPHREKPPQLVARRNARERRRVQAVNTAFGRLRRAVASADATPRTKRISKVKTLRSAIEYISQLQRLLQSHPICRPRKLQPENLVQLIEEFSEEL